MINNVFKKPMYRRNFFKYQSSWVIHFQDMIFYDFFCLRILLQILGVYRRSYIDLCLLCKYHKITDTRASVYHRLTSILLYLPFSG